MVFFSRRCERQPTNQHTTMTTTTIKSHGHILINEDGSPAHVGQKINGCGGKPLTLHSGCYSPFGGFIVTSESLDASYKLTGFGLRWVRDKHWG